jgi:hypothetical protein
MLLRSQRNENDPNDKNIDVIFKGVFYVEAIDMLRGVEFDQPTAEELHYLEARTQTPPDDEQKYYVIASGGRRWFVGAAYAEVIESDMDPMVSSLLTRF